MSKIIDMPRKTYTAKSFEGSWETASFTVSGTLDGFIDLATPNGTYPLSIGEAQCLIAALSASISDVQANCLHESDVLLVKEKRNE